MFLTQSGGFFGPIAVLMGKLLNLLYTALNSIGIVNIGITIIVFTIITRLFLLPSMFKQNRSSKVMNYIQPEINKVTKKYRGKKDQDSMLAQNREIRAIQDKYGVSLTSGCLTSLIQLPIFFSLYSVIQNIPAYVGKIKDLYEPIADKIFNNPQALEYLNTIKEKYKIVTQAAFDEKNYNSIIDVLAKFPSKAWDEFSALFNNQGEVVAAINQNVDEIRDIYSFIGGIDLTAAPGFALTTAILIPIASMVFQFLSMNATQTTPTDPSQQATMNSMKMMMRVFPIMSFFVTVNVPAGVGLYWATGSLISFVSSKSINLYFKKCDMEKVVEKCKEKAAKKLAKKEASGKKSFMDKLQEAAYGQAEEEAKVKKNIANASLKSYSSNTMNKSDSNVRYRAGSLASKANVMQRYNDNNNGGK